MRLSYIRLRQFPCLSFAGKLGLRDQFLFGEFVGACPFVGGAFSGHLLHFERGIRNLEFGEHSGQLRPFFAIIQLDQTLAFFHLRVVNDEDLFYDAGPGCGKNHLTAALGAIVVFFLPSQPLHAVSRCLNGRMRFRELLPQRLELSLRLLRVFDPCGF